MSILPTGPLKTKRYTNIKKLNACQRIDKTAASLHHGMDILTLYI